MGPCFGPARLGSSGAVASLTLVNTGESTVAAEELSEGQWFWHEPVPGLAAWMLQVASTELSESAIQIVTTDRVRELVRYRRGRRVRLASSHR